LQLRQTLDGLLGVRTSAAFRFEQPGVVDRESDAIGDDLEDLRVILVEVPLRERPDMENPEQPGLDDQRDAEQRANLLLVEERVESVAGSEVADRDRALFGSNPAGEAFADRDAEADLNRLLETPGSSGRQLIGLLIEKQNRGGVDVKDPDDPNKERLEKPIELEVRKSSLRDPLEVLGQGRSTGDAQSREWYERDVRVRRPSCAR
jgi:hypothetical protein